MTEFSISQMAQALVQTHDLLETFSTITKLLKSLNHSASLLSNP